LAGTDQVAGRVDRTQGDLHAAAGEAGGAGGGRRVGQGGRGGRGVGPDLHVAVGIVDAREGTVVRGLAVDPEADPVVAFHQGRRELGGIDAGRVLGERNALFGAHFQRG